jgi:ABC-type branched-subunit amino acid transport system ATPase component
MADGDVILDVRGVGHAYGGFWAVRECSFDVPRGSVTGLIGPNGAGKSTLVEMLSRSLEVHAGSIVYDGMEMQRWGPERAARHGVARTFQTARVLRRTPVIENVLIGAQGQIGEQPWKAIFRRRAWAGQEEALRREARELLDWLGLRDHVDAPAGSLSGGQRRLMEIARALMARPKLILLDEPTAGVFPEMSRLIAQRVREVAADGVTILLVAHNMDFLETVADEVVCMAQGHVVARGTLDAVRTNEEVISAYLGHGSSGARRRAPEGV